MIRDRHSDARLITGNAHHKRAAGVNNRIGGEFADDLRDAPVVIARAAGLENGLCKAARRSDAAWCGLELELVGVHVIDLID